MAEPDLSLVLPAFNEGLKLEKTLREISSSLAKAGINYELIVVNNGSTDNTEHLLKRLRDQNPSIKPVNIMPNAGYGGGILTGLRIASGKVIGWIDSDGQQVPEDIAKIYKMLISSDAQVAKGVRIVRREKPWRRIQSFFFNALFNILFGNLAADVNAKPKLMKRSVADKIHLTYTNWFIDTEFMVQVGRLAVPVIEVPVEWIGRAEGRSKVRLSTIFQFIRDMMAYRAKMAKNG